MSPLVSRLNQTFQGSFHIEALIADGAIASVYEAEDIQRHRRVALRVLRPELAAVVGARRFLAEMEKTKRLAHPSILKLLESGERDGLIYYVVPLLDGESLRDRLGRLTRFPVAEAVSIASTVGNALHHAHELGLMHGDIKPANILFHAGEPMLSSFGLARAVGAAGARLTEMDLSIGTPYYMSPERAMASQDVGPSSELYSLACVLYEMLVGSPPFVGSTAQIVLGEVVRSRPVPPIRRRAKVPLNVDAALRKALEKRPSDRFESCGAFVEALADPMFAHEDATAPVDSMGEPSKAPMPAAKSVLEALEAVKADSDGNAAPAEGVGARATGSALADGSPRRLRTGTPALARHADRLLVKEDETIRFINVAEIRWVESERNYLRIHTATSEYLVRRRIADLEAQLDPKRFRRIHRSTIVNLDSVDRLVPWFSGGYLVHLRSGEELKLSRGYANKLFGQVGKTL
jgi:tRNA A-37 threonylcarbamoyl transferase component Bud32